MMPRRRQVQPPPIVNGYAIDDVHQFAIVVPESTTNLATNPSFETNTTNWAAVASASIARSTTQQRHGAYSLAITMTAATGDGAAYGTATALSTTSGQAYTASIDVYAPAGMPLKLYFATTGAVQVGGAKQFKGTGRWQRVSVTYNETASTSRRVYLTKDASAMTGTVYLDGFQVENKTYATTYCDGDQLGLVPNQLPTPYAWTGTPHASTSTRSTQARGGGRVLPLSRYGFTLLGMQGLGLAGANVVSTNYAQLDGGEYQRTQKPPRTFTLVGRIQARSPSQLRRLKSDLLQVLDRDIVGTDQPLVLRYQAYDCDTAMSEEIAIPCVYTSGLEGNVDNHIAEPVQVTFTMHQPGVQVAGESGTTLTVQTSVSNVNYIAQRSPAGVWSSLGTGMNNNTTAMIVTPNNLLYAGGTFTDAGGTVVSDIALWTPATAAWTALGTGLNARPDSLAVGPDGTLYAAGQFTTAGGGAAAKIASWNGSAWSALSSGLTGGDATAVVVAPNGDVYVTGGFTTAGGGGATRIAKWNGSAWSALSTGLSGGGEALAVAKNGDIFVGGSFVTAGGVTVNNVARWNGSAFTALGSGTNGGVTALAVGTDGTLYAGGAFTTADGATVNRVAKWNGSAWTAMGSGFNNSVDQLVVLADGRVVASGSFTTANGVALPGGIAFWNGGSWTAADITLSSGSIASAVAPDGTFYIAPGSTGAAVAAATTTVTNAGTARAYPRVTIKGPSSGTARIYQIVNYTTGKSVYLNYTINSGETATLIFTPFAVALTSDFQGNIANTVLAGSNTAEFFLQPGANAISFFSASSSVTATIQWTPAYAALEDATL